MKGELLGRGEIQHYFKFSPPEYKWRRCRQYMTSQVETVEALSSQEIFTIITQAGNIF
jgi:hypothetical protein